MSADRNERSKVICDECGWKGHKDQILTAANPFDPSEPINGCPDCLSIDQVVYVCDEDGCWKRVSCGWPNGEGGYRTTCHTHWRELKE